ncbi:S41 family peptidase [Aurantiacibacter poecillastricola]|uniref:S41 family peptidase n=1 Tax=Aurantiacibacter poecillastricola TaxID=3064385 RepID=UPI00273FE532|nr:S41 family peptidase [Aurantiacibacter sp. 219JJ12-13]MDP5261060.1 S41 family peptidase [Aurantiacibacter sp. 219JJ12-13]
MTTVYTTIVLRIALALLVAAEAVLFSVLSPISVLAREEAPLQPEAVVKEVRAIIAERYVLPERRPMLDEALAEGLASGRYDVDDPALLATLIDADLRRAGQDKHLYISYDPAGNVAMRAGADGGFDMAAYEAQARAANHGIAELRILPGNVRYLDYRGFDWVGEESGAAIDAAMAFLAGGDAVIIDLRRNGGGSPEAVQRMVSYFLAPETPLVTFYMEGEAEPDAPAALTELAGPRMIGKPLYVLTSGGTGSAAEEFAGHVGGYEIGELVGGTTAGAGFRNDIVPVGDRFALSVSVGRAVLASTDRDWEGVGIEPTIPAPVSDARDIAHREALLRLAAQASGEDREAMEDLSDNIAALTEDRSPALALSAYAGTYGDRAIAEEDGALVYRREGRLAEPLVALGGNRFAWRSDPSRIVDFDVEEEAPVSMALGTIREPARSRYSRR